MKAYLIDQNNCYVGEIERQIDIAGNYLLPANSVETPPPTVSENEIQVWENGSWKIAEDISKITFYDKETRKEKKFEFGETIPENVTKEKPIENENFQIFEKDKWIVDIKSKEKHKKEMKIAELKSLLRESDWTQTLDQVNRKGKEWVNDWMNKRSAWHKEMKELESE